MKISDALLECWYKVRDRIAYAIKDGDWSTLLWNIGLVLAVVLAVLALGVGVLALVWKAFGTVLGKIFAVPLVAFILIMSYKMNSKDKRPKGGTPYDFDEWADGIYDYVRDAVFLVLRAVSEYTNIVTPSRASAIEYIDNPYSIEDEFVVFHFLCKVNGTLDTDQFKTDFQRTLRQMHLAHELNGIPRDLIEINGAYYCPLQIFGAPQDFGDYVEISVVFATEKTVKLTRAAKVLNLDHALRARRKQGETHGDDPLFR